MRSDRGWLAGALGAAVRMGLVLGAASLVALSTAAPADAYLRDGVTLDTNPSTDSFPAKTVLSKCPAGKVGLSTGASLSVPQGPIPTGLGLRSMFPGVHITAVEADSESAVWTLSGQTFCVAETATPPTSTTGGPYVKNLTRVFKEPPYSHVARKEVAVDCPVAAPVPIGGGFFVDGQGRRNAHLAVGRAMRRGGSFVAEAHATDVFPPAASWALWVYALCANVSQAGGSYLTDLTTHVQASPVNSDPTRAVRAVCPAGKRVVGGGAVIEGSTGDTPAPAGVVLLGSSPSKAFQSSEDAWFASGAEEDPVSATWRVWAIAKCAKAVS